MPTELQLMVAALPERGVVRATGVGLHLDSNIGDADWQELMRKLAMLTRQSWAARQTATAWLGDALAQAERFHGQIAMWAETAGLHPGTLRNAKMVCTRIPLSWRHYTLKWSHHFEIGIAFSDEAEIKRWIGIAVAELLSTAELRKRIRAYVAQGADQAKSASPAESAETFRFLRDLRAASRSVVRGEIVWKRWDGKTAQSALTEIAPLVALVDDLRARALVAPRPANLENN